MYLVLCIATYLMLRILIDYTSFRNDVGFLRFKAPYVNYPWWKAAFYVHVFTAILALLAGFTQFSNLVLQDHRRFHRLAGRIYAYDILIVNFPGVMRSPSPPLRSGRGSSFWSVTRISIRCTSI